MDDPATNKQNPKPSPGPPRQTPFSPNTSTRTKRKNRYASLLARDEPAPDPRGKAEIIVGKQRHGPPKTIELAFEAETTWFSNLAREETLADHF